MAERRIAHVDMDAFYVGVELRFAPMKVMTERQMPGESVPVLVVGGGGGAEVTASMLLARLGVDHRLVSDGWRSIHRAPQAREPCLASARPTTRVPAAHNAPAGGITRTA